MRNRARLAGLGGLVMSLARVTHDGITDPVATPEIVDMIVEALESI